MFSSLLPWLNSNRKTGNSRNRQPSPHRARVGGSFIARFERLEDRTVLSAYSAASAAELIADVNAANKAGGTNTITLTAPTTSPYVLTAVNNTTDGATGLPVIAGKDKLTIVGNGDEIERLGSAIDFRLFDVAAGASLTLDNLTLYSGIAMGRREVVDKPAEGGAVYNQGALTLNDVDVVRNSAQGYSTGYGTAQTARGGSIYSSGELTVQGGYVTGGKALGGNLGIWSPYGLVTAPGPGDGGAGLGGGVYIAGGTASFTDGSLQGAAQGGGGWDLPSGAGAGGALYVAAGTVTLSAETFAYNRAVGGQGYYYANNDTFSPTNTSASGPGLGGALAVYGGTVSVTNGTLANSLAQGGSGMGAEPGGNGLGGAIDVQGGTLTLNNDTVSNNTATGGYCYSSASGDGLGGALAMNGGTVSLTNVTLAGNLAEGGSLLGPPAPTDNGLGGAIDVQGGTLTLNSDTVSNNTAQAFGQGSSEGGGLYIAPPGMVYIDAPTLANVVNNTADSYPNIDGPYLVVPSGSQPPTVVDAASASPSPVTGTTTNLTVLGNDAAGKPSLTYSWAVTSAPAGAPTPTFSTNGGNAAQNTTATFYRAGNYTFQATITDPSGLASVSSVTVTVNQTLTSIAVSPTSVTLAVHGQQQFQAATLDQFGQDMAVQPTTFTWSLAKGGVGAINKSGLYTAPGSGPGSAIVKATASGLTGIATVKIG